MSIFESLFLGIVQGLTEFLPVSSSGHLVLFQRLFGIEEGAMSFSIAVHFATLISVFIVFWKDILEMIKRPFSKLTLLVVVGTIPTVIIALLFKDFFEEVFNTGATLGLEFLITGSVLLYAESVKSKDKGIDHATYTDAVVVGVAQGLAILPAVSRSGLTIAGAFLRGLNREFALKFSFLMSIPPILGAALLDTYDVIKTGQGFASEIGTIPLIAGMVAAAVSGYFAIRFMLRLLKKGSFKYFAYYVFILGALIIMEQLFFGRIFGRLF